MTEHLPECPSPSEYGGGEFAIYDERPCICDRLRACEGRVRDEEDRMVPIIRRNEYQRGLTEARDAVAALTAGRERMDYEDGPEVYGAHNAYIDCVVDALAAIDALRGGS